MEFANAASLLAEGLAALAAAPAGADMIVDLQAAGRVDSAGLAVLLEWLARARRDGHRFTVIHAPEKLLALAKVSELDRIILAKE